MPAGRDMPIPARSPSDDLIERVRDLFELVFCAFKPEGSCDENEIGLGQIDESRIR